MPIRRTRNQASFLEFRDATDYSLVISKATAALQPARSALHCPSAVVSGYQERFDFSMGIYAICVVF